MQTQKQAKGVHAHQFSIVPGNNIQRSKIRQKPNTKTTFDSDYIVPILVYFTMPGDFIQLRVSTLTRMLAPLDVPMMDTLRQDVEFFHVPLRLVMENFRKLMGERYPNPDSSIDILFPGLTADDTEQFTEESLGDYLGCPINVDIEDIDFINALPFRAYYKLWNDWYRHQKLQNALEFNYDSAGPDDWEDYVLQKSGKFFDYFTTALPNAQEGDPVSLPLTGNAPVKGIGHSTQDYPVSNISIYETGASATRNYVSAKNFNAGGGSPHMEEDPNNAGYPAIYADMSQLVGISINDLREYVQLQRFQELEARGGHRYTEILRSHFGVNNPDWADRSEYLGGFSTPVIIHANPQTSESGTTPLGTLSAYATAISSGNGFTKSFNEHGIIIGVQRTRAYQNYQEGLPKHFSIQDRYDLPFPIFANLGEEPIYKRELFCDGTATDEEVFGYSPRYEWWRFHPNMITGKLRSQATNTLEVYHSAEEFGAHPVLNSTFIQSNSPVDRLASVPAESEFAGDFYFEITKVTALPMYGNPSLGDRF